MARLALVKRHNQLRLVGAGYCGQAKRRFIRLDNQGEARNLFLDSRAVMGTPKRAEARPVSQPPERSVGNRRCQSVGGRSGGFKA